MVSLPIFIILIGVLVSISNLTTVPWNIEPTGQSMATLTDDTEVTFDNPSGETLPAKGTYEVTERYITLNMTSDGNLTKESGARGKANADGVQAIKVLIREPQNASGKRPGVVFMHGAGYGTCDNSFGDVASGMASAGFVTAVLDKPVWNTTDINRDYPASAKAYDQVIEYLRDQSDVDEAKVGIYATSGIDMDLLVSARGRSGRRFPDSPEPDGVQPTPITGIFRHPGLHPCWRERRLSIHRPTCVQRGHRPVRTEQFRPRHTQTRRLRRTHLCGLRFERRDDGAGRRCACDSLQRPQSR